MSIQTPITDITSIQFDLSHFLPLSLVAHVHSRKVDKRYELNAVTWVQDIQLVELGSQMEWAALLVLQFQQAVNLSSHL